VKNVIDKCDGLPLTLEVMGCHLKDHQFDPLAWKQTIDTLSRAESIDGTREDRLWSSLKLSYDSLGEKEQQMFLQAATLFFKKRVEHVLWGWSTTYPGPEMLWSNLKKKSLVKERTSTELDDYGIYFQRTEIWVHEQLRDLATDLSRGAIVPHHLASGDLETALSEANVVSPEEAW
jgi:hypothetical protein